MPDANIRAVITAKDDASNVLKSFGNTASSVGDKVASVAKVAAIGLAAAGAAAVAFGYSSVKAYQDSENTLAQLNAVIKSTGGAAGVTADQATKLALSLQKTTRYSDEAVLGAENLLLTFTSIGKDVFPEATSTILDMSTALGQDLKSSTIQLGKALQDPIRGITALRRVGVNFSDAQKDMIESLVKSGKTMEAQKLILKELKTEFGGSAEAAGKTFAGSLDKLKNSFNDIQESIGKTIVIAITPFIQKAAEFIASVDWEAVINRTTAAITRFITEIVSIRDRAVELYQNIVAYISPGFERFIFVVQEAARIVAQTLMPSLQTLSDTVREKLLPQIIAIWNAIEPGFTGALKVLGIVIGTVLLAAAWVLVNALNVIATVLGFVINVTNQAIQWFGNLAGVIINYFKGIPGFIAAVFNGLVDIITWPFREAFRIILEGVKTVKDAIGSIKSGASNAAQNIFDPAKLFHKAGGGSVTANTPYMVGEQGQEMFVPNQAGTIIPNDKLGSGGSGVAVNVTFNGIFTGNQMEFRKLAKQVFEAHADAVGMGTA